MRHAGARVTVLEAAEELGEVCKFESQRIPTTLSNNTFI
jgi:hypothetical protein